MLRLLSSNQPIAFMVTVLTVVIAGVLSVWQLDNADVSYWHTAWVQDVLDHPAGKIFYWVGGLLAGAWSVHFVYNRHEFIEDRSALASWMYVLFWMTFSMDQITHPLLWANIPLIWSVHWIFSVYRQNDAKNRYFNAGVLMGTSTLISTNLIWLTPILFVCIAYTRSFKWREWWLAFSGLLLPWFMYLTLKWVVDPSFIHGFDLWAALPCSEPVEGFQWIGMGLLLLAALVGFQKLFASFTGSSNRARNTRSIFIILFLGTLVSAYPSYQNCKITLLTAMILPLSFLIPQAFQIGKKIILTRLFFWALFLSLVVRIWILME